MSKKSKIASAIITKDAPIEMPTIAPVASPAFVSAAVLDDEDALGEAVEDDAMFVVEEAEEERSELCQFI
jgi:hypothetical protein